jgi:uncharacterized protein (UPF0332 family)
MDETVENWWKMAQDARDAAGVCLRSRHYRSAVSRAYYAAFSALTAELLRRGAAPRTGFGTWSHAALPRFAQEQLRRPLGVDVARDVRQMASRCYKLRQIADYVPAIDVAAQEARLCLRYTAAIMRTFGTETDGENR